MTVHFLYPPQPVWHGFVPKKMVNVPLAQSSEFLKQRHLQVEAHGGPVLRYNLDQICGRVSPGDWVVAPLLEGTACAETLKLATSLAAMSGARSVAISHMATFAAKEILEAFPTISRVIVGEDELSLYQLCSQDEPSVRTLLPGAPVDASLWAFPVRARWGRYAALQTSRGCAHSCTFCSANAATSSIVKPLWHGLSVEKLHEWLALMAGSGVRFIELVDSDFLGTTPVGLLRAETLCRMPGLDVNGIMASTRPDTVVEHSRIIEKLANFGFVKWQIGVESSDAETLLRYGKGFSPEVGTEAVDRLLAFGLSVRLEFIMFEPWSTMSSLRGNLRFLRRLSRKGVLIHRALFNRLRIGNWTPVFQVLLQEGRLARHIFPLYDYVDTVPVVARVFAALRSIHTQSLGAALTLAEMLERLLDLGVLQERLSVLRSLSELDNILLDVVELVFDNEGRIDVEMVSSELLLQAQKWLDHVRPWLVVDEIESGFPGGVEAASRALRLVSDAPITTVGDPC